MSNAEELARRLAKLAIAAARKALEDGDQEEFDANYARADFGVEQLGIALDEKERDARESA